MADIPGVTPLNGVEPKLPGFDNYNPNAQTSFSGSDIVCVLGGRAFAQVTGMTVSVQREKVPVYCMGDPNPKSYSRGKRGIAGALMFSVWDRSALLAAMKEDTRYRGFIGKATEFRNARFSTGDTNENSSGVTTNAVDGAGNNIVSNTYVYGEAFHADQLMPFNIIVVGVNEYGGGAVMSVRGAEIVNNNTSVSVDDIQTEESMTYVARHMIPWQPITVDGQTDIGAQSLTSVNQLSALDVQTA